MTLCIEFEHILDINKLMSVKSQDIPTDKSYINEQIANQHCYYHDNLILQYNSHTMQTVHK